jgi:uncharacterized repeat protein (TIGR03803 family)
MMVGRVKAQTFTTLCDFSWDGAWPSGLILSSNTLYGTASGGGNTKYRFGAGTLFAINTDGTGFTNLYMFTAIPSGGPQTNSDGASPSPALALSGNTLYGTAGSGGSSGNGTVFALKTDGMGFTTLHSFTAPSTNPPYANSDGASPSSLILSSNTLYGMASQGGTSGWGTVFAINTDGTGFTNLHSFTGGSDGGVLDASLILSGHTLYGTAYGGGSSGNGTVFKVSTDGTGFANLYDFTATRTNLSGTFTNSDGANPRAGLTVLGNTLYGTAYEGGSSGNGTVFKVNADGTGFTTLYSFAAGGNDFFGWYTNSDGANPWAGLVVSGNTLYGTAVGGGSSGLGTVFAVNTDGTGFTTLYSFAAGGNDFFGWYTNSDGAQPSSLILSGNTLYGTAVGGGSVGVGTAFSLSMPPPRLTIIPSRTNLILTWPTYAPGVTLQSTTNLVSPVWTTNSPAPVVVNGQNTVTNPICGTQQFFRLSQ